MRRPHVLEKDLVAHQADGVVAYGVGELVPGDGASEAVTGEIRFRSGCRPDR
jgi:hypothetical protein